MAIPALNSNGLLPPGIHAATLDEIRHRFGSFQSSDQRPRLFARLEELADAMRNCGLFGSVLIDGSFVTGKPAPNDIDLIAVLNPGHDFERDLPITEYALVSRVMLFRRFRFDVIIAEHGSAVYETYVEFFSLVRELPGLKKGLLRIEL